MDWHRLFGLVLTDFFTNSPYQVELEKDLSLKQQFLDVVIVRKTTGTFQGRLPDGLDNLADHNLISFKSHQETFDAWTVKELLGHYVNYRKQVSPFKDQLLAEENFRLYGVCARYPNQLAAQINLELLQPGVLQCRWGTDLVRLVILRDLPQKEHNAPLHLFSAVPEKVQYGQGHYQQHSPETSSLIGKLLSHYKQEGFPMPYTMEDFRKEIKKEFLESMTPQERMEILQTLTSQDRKEFWEKLTAQERVDLLEMLTAQERMELLEMLASKELSELIQKAPIEKRLQGLTREEIEKYLQEMNDDSPDTPK